MKLTGNRVFQRDQILALARSRVITWEQYKQKLAVIQRREAKVVERIKEKERLEAVETEKRVQELLEKGKKILEAKRKEKEEKKKAAAEKRKATIESKKLSNQLVFRVVAGVVGDVSVRDVWKSVKSDARLIINGKVDKLISYDPNYKTYRFQFLVGGGSDADFIFDSGDVLLFVKPSKIDAKKLVQKFRDGIQHCVFTPILNKLNEKMEETTSSSSKKRYIQRINKLHELKSIYEEGVPEENMEEVAKASGFVIIFNDVIGDDIKVYNESGRLANLRLTNTRENHIDEGSIVLDQDFEQVSGFEMENKWLYLKQEWKKGNKIFYHVEGDIKNGMPNKLRLLNKAYSVYDSENEIMKKFDLEMNIAKYRLNASKFPEVNEFIKTSRIVNGWCSELNGGEATGHIDMPKAYTQFKNCDWYKGFLGVIHQFRSGNFDYDWINKYVGIYKFTITGNTNPLFEKLGMTVGSTHILPSPEITYFMDKGMTVHIDSGAWGSTFDMEFPDYMMENRRYCLWSGRMGMERKMKSYTFPGSRDFAGHLTATLTNCEVLYWKDENLITVKKPVNNLFTNHHILSFITSYTRIQMLEAMSKFDYSQLVKVVMDGIYYRGSKPSGLEWFVEKEMKNHSFADGWYENVDKEFHFKPIQYSKSTCIAGQGGAGKTYGIMNNGGYNTILYVAPQHVLGMKQHNTYNIKYTTIHQLIGIECQPYYTKHSYPPVIVIDELTQIESSWIDKALEMYKDSLILILGDIDSKGMWYQTRNGCPGDYSKIWKPVGVDYVVVEGDRRSRDDQLKQLKLVVRDVMNKVFIDGDQLEEISIIDWVMKNFKITSFDDAVGMFKKGDTWIAGTHKTNKKLLENGVVSGWYKKGGHISNVELNGYEKRGSYTIHSYQGATIEDGKIFISINDMFEFTMFYTAISRAVNFDQLVFVGK